MPIFFSFAANETAEDEANIPLVTETSAESLPKEEL